MLATSDLADCLDRLDSLQATQLEAAVQALLRPVALYDSTCSALTLPALATLPLSAQANLLLLLRAAPHRFSGAQRAALLGAVSQLAAGGACGSDLLQLLADDGGSAPDTVPHCPDFLYTSQPCFPWAPARANAATAAALQQQLAAAAAAEQQQQQYERDQEASTPGSKRPADGNVLSGSPTKRQRQAAAAGMPHAVAAATGTTELDAAIAAVQRALAAHAAGGSGMLSTLSPDLLSALGTLLTHAAAGGTAGTAALQTAGLDSLEDDSLLLMLLQDLVTPSSSFARCAAAAGGLLLPRLRALAGASSRDLAAAAEHVGASNPQAFISACLQPLLASTAGLNKYQAELLSSCLKTALPAQLLPDVLAAACAPLVAPNATAAASGGTAGDGGAGTMALAAGSTWNEHTVAVLQAVLNCKPSLSAPAVDQLAGAMLAAASASSASMPAGSGADLAASPKFAKLVLSLVKQHAAEAVGAKAQLQAVAAACKSFIAKSLVAAVARL